MFTEAGFLAVIAAEPEDDTHRLVYADFLEEQGQVERAEFIRVQVELEPVREDFYDDHAAVLRAREEQLYARFQEPWHEERERLVGKRASDIDVVYRRGLPEAIALPVQWFLDEGATLRRAYPTVQRVDLFRVNGWGARLADCPHLDGLRQLELACWTSAADLEALLTSPHLGSLLMLRVWLSRSEEDEARYQALERCSRLPVLEEVQAVWADPARFAGREGRPVIRCIDPEDRTYAMAPGGGGYFDACFPGRLPDGTQVFGLMPAPGSSRIPLLLFDREGNQIEERMLELPPHLVPTHGPDDGGPDGLGRWRELEKEIAGYLREALGHRPCMVRVKGLHFSDDWGPSVEDWSSRCYDEFGRLDDPDLAPEDDGEDGPAGRGGTFHRGFRDRRFVFGNGNDWFVNGITGDVEST